MIIKIIVAFFVLQSIAIAATCSTVTYYSGTANEIVYTFDTSYTCGQFANGDWWVVGPVTINSITPTFSGGKNGWQANPAVGTEQGFDSRGSGYNAALVPSLPYTTTASIESIVKVVSHSDDESSYVDAAAVLTVLSEAPVNDGATVFRPPYMGTTKPLYNTGDINTALLSVFTPVGTPPSLATVEGRFTNLRLEHMTLAQRNTRPRNAYGGCTDGYGPQCAMYNYGDILRLNLNDAIGDKMAALVKVLQHGIDQAHAVIGGMRSPGTGHDPGHATMAAFAAVMLNISTAKTTMQSATGFEEQNYLTYDTVPSQFGQSATESGYWNYILTQDGNQSNRDPYGFIDGSLCSTAAGYQAIVSQNYKGAAIVGKLIPEVFSEAWPTTNSSRLAYYTERWVATGNWCQPDPCEPADNYYKTITDVTEGNPTTIISNAHGRSNGETVYIRNLTTTPTTLNDAIDEAFTITLVDENSFTIPIDTTGYTVNVGASARFYYGYGTNFGMDGAGSCIKDADLDYYNSPTDFACQGGKTCGRYAANHGTNANTGQYADAFVGSMWTAYYATGSQRNVSRNHQFPTGTMQFPAGGGKWQFN